MTTEFAVGLSKLHRIAWQMVQVESDEYRIYSRISRPAYKPTLIPTAENVAKLVTLI